MDGKRCTISRELSLTKMCTSILKFENKSIAKYPSSPELIIYFVSLLCASFLRCRRSTYTRSVHSFSRDCKHRGGLTGLIPFVAFSSQCRTIWMIRVGCDWRNRIRTLVFTQDEWMVMSSLYGVLSTSSRSKSDDDAAALRKYHSNETIEITVRHLSRSVFFNSRYFEYSGFLAFLNSR